MKRKIKLTAGGLKMLRDTIEHEDKYNKMLDKGGFPSRREAEEWAGARHWTEKCLHEERHDLVRLAEIGMESLKRESVSLGGGPNTTTPRRDDVGATGVRLSSKDIDLFVGRS